MHNNTFPTPLPNVKTVFTPEEQQAADGLAALLTEELLWRDALKNGMRQLMKWLIEPRFSLLSKELPITVSIIVEPGTDGYPVVTVRTGRGDIKYNGTPRYAVMANLSFSTSESEGIAFVLKPAPEVGFISKEKDPFNLAGTLAFLEEKFKITKPQPSPTLVADPGPTPA